MNALSDKFQIKPGMRGGAFGCPPDVDLPFPSIPTLAGKGLDYVIVFVRSVAELTRYAETAERILREDGILWFCYPKNTGKITTDITRGRGWEPVLEMGLAGCRQIAVDDTWSALRFREPRFSRKSEVKA